MSDYKKKLRYESVGDFEEPEDRIPTPVYSPIAPKAQDDCHRGNQTIDEAKGTFVNGFLTGSPKTDNQNGAVEEMEEPSRECEVCGLDFADMPRHLEIDHNYGVSSPRLSGEGLRRLAYNATAQPTGTSTKNNETIFKHKCSFCGEYVIGTFTDIGRHCGVHTKECFLMCTECKISFLSVADIENHLLTNPSCCWAPTLDTMAQKSESFVIQLYSCTICQYVQMAKENVILHWLENHSMMNIEKESIQTNVLAIKPFPLVCTESDRVQWQNLMKLNESRKGFEAFLQKKDQHWSPHTSYKSYSNNFAAYSQLYKCMGKTCKYSTAVEKNFMDHLYRHATTEISDMGYLQCAYCTIDMSQCFTPRMLPNHITEQHAKCQFFCVFCSYRSLVASSVLLHKRIKHGILDYTLPVHYSPGYEVSFDEFTSNIPALLKKTVKAMPCLYLSCERKFFSFNAMSKHFSNEHDQSMHDLIFMQRFVCIYCGKPFSTKKQLRDHLPIDHPEKYPLGCERILTTDNLPDEPENLMCLDYINAVKPIVKVVKYF